MQKYKMPISRLRMMVCLIGMLLPMCMFAQQITVQGVVKDQTGETVIGASVMEKGTTNGTITGIDGDFSLNMSSNGTLVVSFVGYKTQEVQVKGQKQLQVVLSEDAEMLDEVVVIGYGTMKKSDLTGAVSSIGNKDIKDSPVSNLGQAIQGKISGVQIVDAGKPGDNVSIKIRGLGSINNCDPLVVIDGVPTDLGLSSLNMADVERLDVLKDASATAIYGSRGANGVVMITTKRGTEGKGKLAVSANYSFQNATNVPSLLNAAQYAELSNDMMVNSGRNPNPEWANPSELLASGAIDGYCVAEPFGAQAVVQDYGHVLYDSTQLWQNSICCALVMNGSFLEKNKEAVDKLVAGYEEAGNRLDETTAKTLAEAYLGQNEKTLEVSMQWIHYDNLQITKSDYEQLTERMKKYGINKNPPSYEDFVYQPESSESD